MASFFVHTVVLLGITNFLGMIPGFPLVMVLPGPVKFVGGAFSDGVFTLLCGLLLFRIFGVQPGILLPVLSCAFPLVYYLNPRYQHTPGKLTAYLVGLWVCYALTSA